MVHENLCTCGHPKDWHRFGGGSCLECFCTCYVWANGRMVP